VDVRWLGAPRLAEIFWRECDERNQEGRELLTRKFRCSLFRACLSKRSPSKNQSTAMHKWIVGILFGLVCVAGCSNKRPEAVPVSGTVKNATGKPVTDVVLILASETGSILDTYDFSLDSQGHFEGA